MNIVISNRSELPIYAQIETQIKEQILSGALAEGEALPSIRKLAKEIGVSVITTTRAYGDLEKEGEEFLAGQEIPLAADVLKVGHHGSRSASSEKFLNRVRPCVSVISCSATNNYGHPAPETLERLEKAGSLVCVTKDCGAVTIQTNGMRYQVRTFFER